MADGVTTEVRARGIYIDGRWHDAASGKTFPVTNPATGEVIAHVADGTAEDARRAIEAAAAAFPSWSRMTATRRGRLLRAAADLMRQRREELGRQLTREQGKPLAEGIGEIDYAASFLDWFAGEGERLYGEVIPYEAPG